MKKNKMVKITLDLIRKRAEHNEGEISTLEEISLHQQNIDKIDMLNQACRNLRILLMQNNLIERIENLNMLKRLEYLNLALNNIQVIENLEGLESLKKLDLTVNFIGDARGVKNLRGNQHLEILYLTGNPCTDYENYREYVVATLPQLDELDAVKITRSERIMALQIYAMATGEVVRGYEKYNESRKSQSDKHGEKMRPEIDEASNSSSEENEAKVSAFWNEKSPHTPEERRAIARMSQRKEAKRARAMNNGEVKQPYVPRLFNEDGTRPYNVNQPKVPFVLNDETDPLSVILEVEVYKHLDTSHLNVDVQPNYVRVTIKNKILQLCLPCEISVDKSDAKRNVTSGRLVITMPRLEKLPTIFHKPSRDNETIEAKTQNREDPENRHRQLSSRRELLEIGPSKMSDELDFSRIYRNRKTSDESTKRVSEDFIDDPCVPPLV